MKTFLILNLALLSLVAIAVPVWAQSPAPSISAVGRNPVAIGGGQYITGSGFGSSQGSSTLLLNGAAVAQVSYWSDSEIDFPVPAGTATGSASIQVTTAGGTSNTVSFTVAPVPVISGISPASGPAGTQVTISGSGFGATAVQFNWVALDGGSVALQVVSWSDGQVVALMPSNLSPGQYTITLQANFARTTTTFTVTPPGPQIASINPASGPVGTRVTVTGSGFGATQGSGTVTVGATSALIVSWSDAQIIAVVASGSTTGNLIVQQGGTQSNAINFMVNNGSLLQVSTSDAPLQVNLTSPQTLDWIHWGRIDANTPDHKAGSIPLISNYTAIGGAQVFSTNGVVSYSWTDGNQQAAVSGTNADVQVFAGGGFQITVPADTTVKTLNLYALVQSGQAQVQASLSDGSATSTSDQSVSDLDISSKIYSIDFRAASPGQTLTVAISPIGGFIGLEAATLTPHLPVVTLASPTAGQSFSVPASVPLNAVAYQYNTTVRDVKFTGSNGTVLDQPNSPFVATWGPLAQGHYSVSASATDAAGLSNNSSPVELDAIGSGGSLSLQVGAASGPVNLTAQGTTDWVLWGAQIPAADPASTVFDRKAGVTPIISNYTPIGNHVVYDANDGNTPPAFTYTDGSQSSSSFTQSMLYAFGQSDGYEITVPADTNQRTLQLYTGVNFGQARITAFLSDGSAAVVTDDSVNSPVPSPAAGNYSNAVYTIHYSAASAHQTLTVRYTLEQSYNASFGGMQLPSGELYLMAAALSGAPSVPLNVTITGVQPASGAAGSTFTLTGSGFGAVQNDTALTINGSPAAITSWSDSQIIASVPFISPGAYSITLYGVAGPQFTVVPAISSLNPAAGPVGSSVTILGSGFGAAQGTGSVTFNGVAATVGSWADSSITAVVPAGATSGNVVVTTVQGTAAAGVLFTVLPSPAIGMVAPASGPPGTQVAITGSNFGATQGGGTVQIGNQPLSVLNWSDGAVSAVIPAGALTGNIVLTASSGGVSNAAPFSVNYGGPLLQFSVQDTPLQVNLTSAQTLDWIHWGRISLSEPDRKAGTTLISDVTPVNGAQPSFPSSGLINFAWSDGQQAPSLSGVSSDWETSTPGTGFQITVPADTSVKTLNLYVEVFSGQGQLQASLSDGSAAAISDQSIIDGDTASKVYSIDFRAASPGQMLTITFSALSGGVGLQAATLTPHLPVVSVASPSPGQSFSATGTVPVSVTAAQFDSLITDIKSTASDRTVFDGSSSPLSVNWSPSAAGHYSMSATAADSAGLSNTSSPVEFDVIGQGGSLSIQENAVPSSPVDLNAQGPADWVLWGPLATGDFIINNPGGILARKSGVAPLISNYKPVGNHPINSLLFTNPLCFMDGQQGYCSGSELSVHGLGDGFEITVAADATPRTLQLFVGADSGDGNLVGFLSDGSAPVVTEVGAGGPPAGPPGNTTLYTVSYNAASPGQTLTLRFTLNSDQGGGTVDLIGAALSGPSATPTVPAPQISSITPNVSPINTQVVISGTSFGSTQGAGSILFAGIAAQVVSWSDTSITVLVPDISDGSTIQVIVSTPHGISNAVSFTVPTYKLYPASLNLLVGQSSAVTAKDSSGNIVSGLSWVAKNPTIVSLSSDDPPQITGLAAGSTTVYAGDVPLPVTVFAGTELPPSTPIWSVPLSPGATNATLTPAVPNDNGIDVFALDNTGVLSALSGDGQIVWSHLIPGITGKILPDFAGGVFVGQAAASVAIDPSFNVPVLHQTHSINKVDPATGQLTPLYTYAGEFSEAVPFFISNGIRYDNGFVFTDGPETQAVPSRAGVLFIQDAPRVIAIDPTTGQTLANVNIDRSVLSCETGTLFRDSISGPMIVAGDGNAYVPYVVTNETDQGCGDSFISSIHILTNLMVLRVSPDGSFAKIPINQLTFDAQTSGGGSGNSLVPYFSYFQPYPQNAIPLSVITNADQGVAVISPVPQPDCGIPCEKTMMSLISNDAVTSQIEIPVRNFKPVLQREDGAYIGNDNTPGNINLVALDGSLVWQKIAPDGLGGFFPLIPLYAMDDGGVIATSTGALPGGSSALGTLVTFDKDGNVVSEAQDSGAVESFTQNWYEAANGAVLEVPLGLVKWALGFWPFHNGNLSFTGAASIPVDSETNAKVANILTESLWNKLGKSNCETVFKDPRALPIPKFSLFVVRQKQQKTNFYDTGRSDAANITLKAVTGGQIVSQQNIVDYLAGATAATLNLGFDRQTAVILAKDFFSPSAEVAQKRADPKYTLVHEVLLHAYAGQSDDQLFGNDFLVTHGLWRPPNNNATVNLSTWISTDCRCTPGNPKATSCKPNSAPW